MNVPKLFDIEYCFQLINNIFVGVTAANSIHY